MRHLERLFPRFSLLPHLFPFFSPDKNINADLHATVTKPLMNSWIFGNTQRKNTSAIMHGKKTEEFDGVHCFKIDYVVRAISEHSQDQWHWEPASVHESCDAAEYGGAGSCGALGS